MSHFGDWMSAYLDGQLPGPRAERLEMHAAQCRECAEELAALEAARRALLASARLEPSTDLTQRLLQVGSDRGAGEAHPRVIPQELSPGADAPQFPALTGELRSRGRARGVALIAAGATAVVVGSLFVLGTPTTVLPDPSDAEALTVLAGRQGRGPVVAPVNLGARDNPIMVREQAGRLALERLNSLSTMRFGNQTVYVLSTDPLHIAWQSGETVIDVVCPAASAEVERVVANYPDGDFPDGIGNRLARGWANLSGMRTTP